MTLAMPLQLSACTCEGVHNHQTTVDEGLIYQGPGPFTSYTMCCL
jgi:hypothetical protein